METTYAEILAHKRLTPAELEKEKTKVLKFNKYETNRNSFVGNKLIYHFQMDELCKTKRRGKMSLYEIYAEGTTEEAKEALVKQTEQRGRTGTTANRLFECWRINNGSITFFKMSSATYMYRKYNATAVLDVTAGWGGRLLGAINCGIKYTGFDTNINLKEGYDSLIGWFPMGASPHTPTVGHIITAMGSPLASSNPAMGSPLASSNPAMGVPEGSPIPAMGVPEGSPLASSIPAMGVPEGSPLASSNPAMGSPLASSNPAMGSPLASSNPAMGVPEGSPLASSIPAMGVPEGSPLASSNPAMGVPEGSPLAMRYEDCLTADFAAIDYDFVLTSPPYEDIEIYSHATYPGKNEFYTEFLIPLIDRCRTHIKRDGWTCFNISPQMYKKLTGIYGYAEAHQTEDLKEQKNGKTSDMIYMWRKI